MYIIHIVFIQKQNHVGTSTEHNCILFYRIREKLEKYWFYKLVFQFTHMSSKTIFLTQKMLGLIKIFRSFLSCLYYFNLTFQLL